MLPSEAGLLSLPSPPPYVAVREPGPPPPGTPPPQPGCLPTAQCCPESRSPQLSPLLPPGSADLSAVLVLLQPLVRMVTAFELSAADVSGGGSASELGPAWSLWGLQCFSTKPSYLDRSNKTTLKLERKPRSQARPAGPSSVSASQTVSLVKLGRWCRSC